MKTIRILLLAVVTALISHGCSDSDSPSLADVPATAQYVAMINAGSFSEAITGLLPEVQGENGARLKECCDLSRVLIFKPSDSRMDFAAATVTDASGLTSLLAEMDWNKRSANGITFYSPNSGGEFSECLIIDNNTAWFLGTRADIKNWRECRRQADKDSFKKYGLHLEVDSTTRLAAYISPAFFGLTDNDAFLKVTGQNGPDHSLTINANLVSILEGKTGENIPFQTLAPVTDTRFSHFLTAGNSLMAAAGIKQGINWGGLVEMLGSGLGTQNQGMLQTLLPYMTSLNGPFAIGIGPFTAESLTSDDLESHSIIIYATLADGKAAQAVNEINGNLRDKGLNPTPRSDGVFAFDLNGIKYRYTSTADGIFLFALNRELESPHPADSILFQGRQAFASLRLPPLKEILPESRDDLAITATLAMEPEGITMKITAGNCDPVMAFQRYFNALRGAVQARMEESPHYFDEY